MKSCGPSLVGGIERHPGSVCRAPGELYEDTEPMKRVWKEIGVGDEAVATTVSDMCRLAKRDADHPGVRDLARRLKGGKSDRQAVRGAFEHVVRSIRYVYDPPKYEKIVAPIYLLSLVRPYHPYGDCDDLCIGLGSILIAMGYGVEYRTIAHKVDEMGQPVREFTHVNLIAVTPGGKIPLDPVMGMAGFDNQKRDVWRDKVTECTTMKQLSLEDGPMALRPRGLSGCACGGRSGCRCRRKTRGCCPQSAYEAPVNVNVITNTGYQDQSIDAMTENRMDQSRMAVMPLQRTVEREREIIQREVPRQFTMNMPAPVVQQVLRPTVQQYAPVAKKKRFREFY